MAKLLLPKGKDEYILLIFLFIFYFICSYPFIFNTSITDSRYVAVDTYFSFDTPLYYAQGFTYISAHPLILLFTKPIIYIGKIFMLMTGDYKSKTLFISVICNILISLSAIYIYKYLKQIISINKKISLLIVAIYSVFSTNLVLAFTIESFTLSVFFLTFSLYFYSLMIKDKIPIPLYACIILPLIIGGITVTNFIIAIFPIILSNDSIKKKIIKILIPSIILGFIVLIEKFFITNNSFDVLGLSTRLELFIDNNTGNFMNKIIDLFWGGPILFSKITSYTNSINSELISLANYTNYYQYTIIFIITFIIMYSLTNSYKNKFVAICAFTLFINIVIHVILKFGLTEPFIYGGHWVYTIPALMGWTFYYVKSNIGKKVITTSFIIIFICLFINNIASLYEFKKLAENLFPTF